MGATVDSTSWTVDTSDVTVDTGSGAPASPAIELILLDLETFSRAHRREMSAGSSIPVGFDVSRLSVSEWAPNVFVQPGMAVRPTCGHETGWVYQNGSSGGWTGPVQPAWPIPPTTVVDGSVTWTPVAPLAGSQDSIKTVSWEIESGPDSALTISNSVNEPLTASAYLSSPTAGAVYSILATITMASGAIYGGRILLTVQ